MPHCILFVHVRWASHVNHELQYMEQHKAHDPAPEDSKETNCDNALVLDICVGLAMVFLLSICFCFVVEALVICCLVL